METGVTASGSRRSLTTETPPMKLNFQLISEQIRQLEASQNLPDNPPIEPKRLLWALAVWLEGNKNNSVNVWPALFGSDKEDTGLRRNFGAKDIDTHYWMGRDYKTDDPLCIDWFNQILQAKRDKPRCKLTPTEKNLLLLFNEPVTSFEPLDGDQKKAMQVKFNETMVFHRYFSNGKYHVITQRFMQKLHERLGLGNLVFPNFPKGEDLLTTQNLAVWNQDLILPNSLRRLSFTQIDELFEYDEDLDDEAECYLERWFSGLVGKSKGGRPRKNGSIDTDPVNLLLPRTSEEVGNILRVRKSQLKDMRREQEELAKRIENAEAEVTCLKNELDQTKEKEAAEKKLCEVAKTPEESLAYRRKITKYAQTQAQLERGGMLMQQVHAALHSYYEIKGRSKDLMAADINAIIESLKKEQNDEVFARLQAAKSSSGQEDEPGNSGPLNENPTPSFTVSIPGMSQISIRLNPENYNVSGSGTASMGGTSNTSDACSKGSSSAAEPVEKRSRMEEN